MPKDDDVVPPPLRLTDEVQQVFDELIHRP